MFLESSPTLDLTSMLMEADERWVGWNSGLLVCPFSVVKIRKNIPRLWHLGVCQVRVPTTVPGLGDRGIETVIDYG